MRPFLRKTNDCRVCVCVGVRTYCSKTTPVHSKTTVFPHDPFSLQLSGYASLFQDDSLTTSFQELNQCPQSVYDGGIDGWWKKKRETKSRETTESLQRHRSKAQNRKWFILFDFSLRIYLDLILYSEASCLAAQNEHLTGCISSVLWVNTASYLHLKLMRDIFGSVAVKCCIMFSCYLLHLKTMLWEP